MEAKISLTFGQMSFVAEGSEAWVDKHLENFYSKIDTVDGRNSMREGKENSKDESNGQQQKTVVSGTLASFLREKNASSNQVQKFLATAAFLQIKGKTRLSTNDISTALKTSNQSKLTNPSECLNKNIGKGFCEKDNGQFYVTEEGFNQFGIVS